MASSYCGATNQDEVLAAKLLQLFEQWSAHNPDRDGISLFIATKALGCNYAAVMRVVRSRPSEFALYNKRHQVLVVCFAYCAVSLQACPQ